MVIEVRKSNLMDRLVVAVGLEKVMISVYGSRRSMDRCVGRI